METYKIEVVAPDSEAAFQMFDILDMVNNDGEMDHPFESVKMFKGTSRSAVADFEPLSNEYKVDLSVHIDARNESDAIDKVDALLSKVSDISSVYIDYAEVY